MQSFFLRKTELYAYVISSRFCILICNDGKFMQRESFSSSLLACFPLAWTQIARELDFSYFFIFQVKRLVFCSTKA